MRDDNRDKDPWLAWWAAWLGWTLDALEFTMFLLIMVPILQGLVGAVASGWLADRVGRKILQMISLCALWSVPLGHCANFPCELRKFFFSHFSLLETFFFRNAPSRYRLTIKSRNISLGIKVWR